MMREEVWKWIVADKAGSATAIGLLEGRSPFAMPPVLVRWARCGSCRFMMRCNWGPVGALSTRQRTYSGSIDHGDCRLRPQRRYDAIPA